MKVATVLFTYNRSEHTQKVLEGLRRNSELPQRLYIFQDGLKRKTDRTEWEKTGNLIRSVDWCENKVISSEENKGLSKSIVDGVTYALKENDAVIVLEDDCVPMPGFMKFMYQCLDKYKDQEKVTYVGGYCEPVEISQKGSDAFFLGRHDSWGWGTWNNRWNNYRQDYDVIRRLKSSREGSLKLGLWGNDLEETLVSRVRGENDSWAVFAALNMLERDEVGIKPCISLIQNIGMDGSGVHCGICSEWDTRLDKSNKNKYILPDNIEVYRDVKAAYVETYGNYTAITESDSGRKEKVLIYGLGNFFHQNEKSINDRYDIIAFADRFKKGYYSGRRIIVPDDINEYEFDRILIMISNTEERQKVADELKCKLRIPGDKIEGEII